MYYAMTPPSSTPGTCSFIQMELTGVAGLNRGSRGRKVKGGRLESSLIARNIADPSSPSKGEQISPQTSDKAIFKWPQRTG